MHKTLAPLVGVVALAVLLGGCCQGPGHTRAAGVLTGTGAGALLGAAASQCNPGAGALVGAGLGMMAGSMVGDALASDQERRGCSPCVVRRGCGGCGRQTVPRRTVIRRRVYIVEDPPPPGEMLPPDAIPVEEEIIIEEPSREFGYGAR